MSDTAPTPGVESDELTLEQAMDRLFDAGWFLTDVIQALKHGVANEHLLQRLRAQRTDIMDVRQHLSARIAAQGNKPVSRS